MRGKLFIGGMGLGAGTMYLMDPRAGARRRAILRDQAVHFSHKAAAFLGKHYRDLRNRARGVAGEIRATSRIEEVADVVLAERVRAHLGHLLPHSYAHTLSVQASEGEVTLRGSCPPGEKERILDGISVIPGVSRVRDELIESPRADLPHEGIGESRSAPSTTIH